MRAFNNLSLLTKITFPVLVLIAVAVGIVVTAKSGLDALTACATQMVDVSAARRAGDYIFDIAA